jgi:hypothetical protein
MKKVVFSSNISTIDFEKVNSDTIIGVQWRDGKRTMVVKVRYGYIGVSNDHAGASWNESSKIDYIKRARKSGCHVFVFENHSELFKWMSEASYY